MASRIALAHSLRLWLSQSNIDWQMRNPVSKNRSLSPPSRGFWNVLRYSVHPAFPARLLYCIRGGLALAGASAITLVLRRSPAVYRYLFTSLLVVVAMTSTGVTMGAAWQVAVSITLVGAFLCGLAVAIIAIFSFANGSLAVLIPALGLLSFLAMLLPVNIAGVRLGLAICAVALLSWYRNNLLQLPSPLYQPMLQAAGLSIGCAMGAIAASLPLPDWPTAARESRLRMCVSANSIRCRIGALAIAFTHVSSKARARTPRDDILTRPSRRKLDKAVLPVEGSGTAPAAGTGIGVAEGAARGSMGGIRTATPAARSRGATLPAPVIPHIQPPLYPITAPGLPLLRRAGSASEAPTGTRQVDRSGGSIRSMKTMTTDLASILEDDLEMEDMANITGVHGRSRLSAESSSSSTSSRSPSASDTSSAHAAADATDGGPTAREAPALQVQGSPMERISEAGLETSLATASVASPPVVSPPVPAALAHTAPHPPLAASNTVQPRSTAFPISQSARFNLERPRLSTMPSFDPSRQGIGRPPLSRFESSSAWALATAGGGLPERLPLLRADIEDLEERSTREHAELKRALGEMVWELHSRAHRHRMEKWASTLHRLNRITRSMVVAEMALRSSPLHGAFVDHVGEELCQLCTKLGECLLDSVIAGCSPHVAPHGPAAMLTLQQDFLRRRELQELSARFMDTFQRSRLQILYGSRSSAGHLPWRAVDLFALNAYMLTVFRAVHVVLSAPRLELDLPNTEHGARHRLDSDATVVEMSVEHGNIFWYEVSRWRSRFVAVGDAGSSWLSSFTHPSKSTLKQATKVALAVMLSAGISAALKDAFGDRDVLFWSAVTAAALAGGSPGGVYRTSMLRLIGTLIGAMAGLIFGAITGGNDIGIAVAVTLWCAFMQYPRLSPSGNGYWATIAGITLPIVLIGLGPSTEALASGRIRQTVVGIVCFILVSAIVWPVSARSLLQDGTSGACALCAEGVSRASHGVMLALGTQQQGDSAPQEEDLRALAESILTLVDALDSSLGAIPPLIVESSSEPSLRRVQFGLIEVRYRDLTLALDKFSRALRLMVNCFAVVEQVDGRVRGLTMDASELSSILQGQVSSVGQGIGQTTAEGSLPHTMSQAPNTALHALVGPALPHLQSLCHSLSRCMWLCSVLLAEPGREVQPQAQNSKSGEGRTGKNDSTPVPSSMTQETRREASGRECLPCVGYLFTACTRGGGGRGHRQAEVRSDPLTTQVETSGNGSPMLNGNGPLLHVVSDPHVATGIEAPTRPGPGPHMLHHSTAQSLTSPPRAGHAKTASLLLVSSWFRRSASAVGYLLHLHRPQAAIGQGHRQNGPLERDDGLPRGSAHLHAHAALPGTQAQQGAPRSRAPSYIRPMDASARRGLNPFVSAEVLVPSAVLTGRSGRHGSAAQHQAADADDVLQDAGVQEENALSAPVSQFTYAHVELPVEIERLQASTAAFVKAIERSMQKHVTEQGQDRQQGAGISAGEAMSINTLGFALQQASASTLLVARLARRIAHATRQGTEE